MPSFGMISIASAMVAECFFCERSWLCRALRKAQYNNFESSFVNWMTTGTLKPKKKTSTLLRQLIFHHEDSVRDPQTHTVGKLRLSAFCMCSKFLVSYW